MRTRTTYVLFSLWLAVVCLGGVFSTPRAHAGELVLQDSKLLVAFDTTSGALTRMEDKSMGWVMEKRPELGLSFRLLAPLPNRRDNMVLGQKQDAVEVTRVSDHEVRLEWRNLRSEHGGVLPITFTARVTLQDGALTFDGTLENDSDLTVETLEYPYFGDLTPPSPGTSLHTEHMWYDNLVQQDLYPHFVNENGYWGGGFRGKRWTRNRACLP